MKNVAKLVTVSFTTRVVVNEEATDSDILEVAKEKFVEQVNNDIHDNLISISNDTECPFGTFDDDK